MMASCPSASTRHPLSINAGKFQVFRRHPGPPMRPGLALLHGALARIAGKLQEALMDDLAEKVRRLGDPAIYAGATRQVEVRETHMSWIFLTDSRVYKLKKPVRNSFLDFSTLARRHFFCLEELRLNRRLAHPTYLSVVPLRRSRTGELSLGGDGSVVDWLVEMKRLPGDDMMDERIRQGRITPREVENVGTILANFYADCPPLIAEGDAYLQHLVEEQRINRAMLLRPDFGLGEIAGPALDTVDTVMASLLPRIKERIANGRIVEGHGDLRPEHVCLTAPPQIIDCLEFNRSMRIIDPYDEVNYLGMECDMLGASWIRPSLNRMLEQRLGNRPEAGLLALYAGFRALLRARICIVHLLERPPRRPEKWRPLTIAYIGQVERECVSLQCRADR